MALDKQMMNLLAQTGSFSGKTDLCCKVTEAVGQIDIYIDVFTCRDNLSDVPWQREAKGYIDEQIDR